MTFPDFVSLAKNEKVARKKMRYLSLAHFTDGHSRYAIADMLKVSRVSVNKWVAAYLNQGLDGLNDKPNLGRPCLLSLKQLGILKDYVHTQSLSVKGGRINAQDVASFIKMEFGVEFQQSNIYRLLHQQGFSWITTRSRHPKQSQAVQEAFKKLPTGNDP